MYHIIIQFATSRTNVPSAVSLRQWAKKVLAKVKPKQSVEITLRIVAIDEMTAFNETYRHKKGPTNVLSFPFEAPEIVKLATDPLGDIVICADVINREAKEQGKTARSHWAHMIVHGILHLLGFDHENDRDAKKMESLEIELMKGMGFKDPYQL